jgi:crotonobetainyl-CoA:carnitine CoA-transferase CaiB-like acyl-CoA transferase
MAGRSRSLDRKFVDVLLLAIGRVDLAPLCEMPGPHQQPVIEALQSEFIKITLDEAGAWLDQLDICWSPVNTYPEALDDKQVRERGFIHRDAHGRRHVGPVIRFLEEPAEPMFTTPALGQHNSEL